jgi:ketosteroid isomerase-like protein
MTVKDLKMALRFYPEDAVVFIQTDGEKLGVPDEITEMMIDKKQSALVVTLKKTLSKLKIV